MKKLIVLLTLLASTMLFSEKENAVDLGLGVFIRKNVYKEKNNNEILPIPVVGGRYKSFYYEAPIEFGYRFYNTENLILTAYGRYSLYTGYKPKDMIDEFKNMDKRKDDFQLGLRGKYNFVYLNTGIVAHISRDVSGRSDGILGRIEINQPIFLDKKVTLLPYIAVEYMSANYTDYYFGIKESEARKGINKGKSYKVDDSFNFEAGIRGMLKVNNNVNTFLSIGYTRYGDSLVNSPLVKSKDIYTVGVGISYSFRF